MADSIRKWLTGVTWPARARLDYWRLRLRPPRYRLLERSYPIHVAWYNKTWRNERQVELPPALRLLRLADPEDTLEVGNVLSHYVPIRHTVVDKYEDEPGTLRLDVVDYHPGRTFGLIIAISTLEHVGWDEPERDLQKFGRAIQHLAGLLAPGGTLWASVPLGHNPAADAFLSEPQSGFEVRYLVRRSKRPGDWREAVGAAPEDHPYLADIPTATAVAFVLHRRPAAGAPAGDQPRAPVA